MNYQYIKGESEVFEYIIGVLIIIYAGMLWSMWG